LTKTDEKLETYLLGDEYQGNFSLALPWSSSRLHLMLPNSLVKVGEGPSDSLYNSIKTLMDIVRERSLDLVRTQYAEKVAVLVVFQGSDLKLRWRLCSLGTNGDVCSFGSMCGEYIDAANTMVTKNPRIYRLLPVNQALQGHIADASITNSDTVLSSGFMNPLSALMPSISNTSNGETPKGAIAVLTGVLKQAMNLVGRNVKLKQEWSLFRRTKDREMGVGGGMSGELSGVLNPPQPVVSISSLRSTGCIGRERVMDNGMHLTKDTEGDGDVEMTILSSTTSYEHTDCAINNESNTLEMQHENMSIDEDESTVKVSAKKPKKKREEKQDEHITEITTRVGRIIRPRNVYT
jgi:hypothetical protein